MAVYYGLDVGGTKIELAAFNAQLEKLYSERVPTPQTNYEDWLNTVETLVLNADQKFGEQGSVGLGLPGFVNRETGIAEITNIRVADGKAILKDLSERL
ncbi:ROK family protein, partial [Xanthomonas citri pv. citri]|nr:ROK family protein [Xanthomonas citri pv. citri]